VFSGDSGTEGTAHSRTQNVRDIFLRIAERVSGPQTASEIEASFNKTFKATLPQSPNGKSSSAAASAAPKPAATTEAPASGAGEIAGTAGLARIPDARLRHALSSLPSAFETDDSSDSDDSDDEEETCVFHFVVEKPDCNVLLNVTTGGASPNARVYEGRPRGGNKPDCTIQASSAVLTSIITGALNPAVALQAGHLAVDSMPRLMMFGNSFDLSKDRYAEFVKENPMPGASPIKVGGGPTGGTTLAAKQAVGVSDMDGVLNNTLKMYLAQGLGDQNKMLKVAKSINSATPSPPMIELKMALGAKYMTKDVPGSWRVDLVFHQPGDDVPAPKKPERRVLYVVTRKSEQDLKSLFSYTWDVVLRYEYTPGDDNDDIEVTDVSVHVSALKFNEVASSAEDQARKDEIRHILSVYKRPARAHAFLTEVDDDAMTAEKSAPAASKAATPASPEKPAATASSVSSSSSSSSSGDASSPVEIEEYDDGSRYEGQFSAEGLRHGRGVFKSADGDTYVGMYKDDVRHGHGVYTTAEGARYEGEFREGLPNGKGVYVFENGDVYTGMFQDDEFHGQGSWSNNGGSSYHGDFVNGQREGKGVLFSLGVTYDGEWKAGKFHGHGIFLYRKGDIYEGGFVSGQFEGLGRYTVRETGQIIEGRFKAGKPVEMDVETAPDAAAPSSEELERIRHEQEAQLSSMT
jgi:putative sterol carrier protein